MKKYLLLILVCVFLLSGCVEDAGGNAPQATEAPKPELTAADFYDGNHKRSEEYAAAFKTKSVELEGLTLHFASNVFDEVSSPQKAEEIAADFAAVAALAPECADGAEVYIVSFTTTDRPVLLGSRLYITPEDIEGDAYPAYVAACIYGESEWWCSMGLGLAALNEPMDDVDVAGRLADYMQSRSGSGILSLHPCYFTAAFADGETSALVRDMAQSIAEYALAEKGAAAFLGGDDVLGGWLESIGLSFDLSGIESESAETVKSMRYYEFGEVDMTLESGNYVLCVDAVDWLGDAESCYAFLLDFASQANRLYERLEAEAPVFWEWLEESGTKATVNFRDSDYPISSRASMLTTAAVVTDDADVLHEICHILMPRHWGDEAWWLCEGLVTYLTAPYVPYHADSIVVDSVLRAYEGDTEEDILLRAETHRCFALLNGCDIACLPDMESPIYKSYEAMGYAAFLNPDNNSAPVATRSIKDDYGERLGNTPALNYPGNELSYLEAMLFTEWLVDKYGLDAVIWAEMVEDCYLELFPSAAAFETEFADFWARRVEPLS